jgi:hypothetical protein
MFCPRSQTRMPSSVLQGKINVTKRENVVSYTQEKMCSEKHLKDFSFQKGHAKQTVF